MKRIRWLAAGGALLIALGAIGVLAQQGGNYEFQLYSIPGGGGESSAGGYSIHGSIGQPFAGSVEGSGWRLEGGILGGGLTATTYELYLPGLSAQP